LDANVLVSGIVSPNGPPAAILRAVLTERVVVCFDERILAEYRDVLTRGRFGFDSELVSDLLDFLETAGESTLAAPLKLQLPDQADVMFIEVAVAAAVDSLVTGNTSHFPAKQRHRAEVVTPRDFLDRLLEG
jgi:putative PIN family toxin of toxin-antitoxin system